MIGFECKLIISLILNGGIRGAGCIYFARSLGRYLSRVAIRKMLEEYEASVVEEMDLTQEDGFQHEENS